MAHFTLLEHTQVIIFTSWLFSDSTGILVTFESEKSRIENKKGKEDKDDILRSKLQYRVIKRMSTGLISSIDSFCSKMSDRK